MQCCSSEALFGALGRWKIKLSVKEVSRLHQKRAYHSVISRNRSHLSVLSRGQQFCCLQGWRASGSIAVDPIQQHRLRLSDWFSRLPSEEQHFGPSFSLDSIHVDPVIRESCLEETLRPLTDLTLQSQLQSPTCSQNVSITQLFQPNSSGQPVRNVVLYGTVGTGKSTFIRKLVLDWCHGRRHEFHLIIPLSCEDLSEVKAPVSFSRLISKKYVHLRDLLPTLSQQPGVLFILNSLEWMDLDFRMAATELCSDPNEPLSPSSILVNLLRGYLLPEASVLVTTRPSAIRRIPGKYVGRYAEICGFSDTELQKMYFHLRLGHKDADVRETENLLEMLNRNLEHHSQLSAACFLPSYCWLTCATLHLLYYTKPGGPVRTLTGIYTSFLRLNFAGEVLDITHPSKISLMLYVARFVGKLAYEGCRARQTRFSEADLNRCFNVALNSEEDTNLLSVFRTDTFHFFLTPSIKPGHETTFVFTIPAMQEYLAALYVVLGENKTTLQRVGREVSEVISKAGEDVVAVVNVLSKFLPLRIFALFNLLRVVPRLYGKVSGQSRENIAQTMTSEMFREEDAFNDDVLDQINSSILGVEGPSQNTDEDVFGKQEAFELFPIFMAGLLSRQNRAMLDQLGCSIMNTSAFEITRALKKHLLRCSLRRLPSSELMDFLFFLYEFQNEAFTAGLVSSLRDLDLSTVRMTPLKCTVVSSVMSGSGKPVVEANFSSCDLDPDAIRVLSPVLRRCQSINLQMNSLGPDSCKEIKDILLHPDCSVTNLRLCNNPLTSEGGRLMAEAVAGNSSLTHLSLLHTDLGDEGAEILASQLGKSTRLQELNLAYNGIHDQAALRLGEEAARHPTLDRVHLYFNELSDSGLRSLQSLGGVRILVSLTEGADASRHWSLILRELRANAGGWDHERISSHLTLLLRDLQSSRALTGNLLRKARLFRVETEVKRMLSRIQQGQL
ncbi:NLR family member X1 isoform X1 [Xenopus laevis]|uniref:NLR family member X1 isoform X1 n=2 Tax=Xenopus laevis TaxID=8355 RepID=A0A1L8FLE8_XENLA|nr:NLR family member X1 isoform X1 [Xenopus laevis]XP_018081280.1 NLR family member X1 isoform X1 [Xenopus laevis]XP_018081281.1 NLR family member X1 isoform X1 [Xenopus laevis]XP_018081282.1 NLR family member X1 isoform X1 [Xenopus laevis]XP_018081284.1 NLR family member X1 isoform X1 [Xenopus laevis]XP_018081286.1 NLR family member X1 isoform X1 [Xenopus laevis]XP_041425173.1 NLR family member X1 isoform X1 [Xenopus laevis]XP_041425174.1 NLR family member X1 isoform X1 [Xenopus laevis]XP_